MPTYEYRCPKGHEFEKFQRMSEPPVAECPECGKPAERIISGGAGLLFRGEGFYITDYRSESYKKAAEKDRSSGGSTDAGSSKGESKGSSKGESKGSSKGESKGESKGGGSQGSGSSGTSGSPGSGKGGE
ncbi:MAG TPA: zinc ribbon domain-containing protein [Longimicrobiales bacterium]|nr:zinc ribbon domain-containing protein [Longimicrobiales bacterium]